MDLSTLYWILILPSLSETIRVLSVIGLIGFSAISIVYFIQGDTCWGDEERKRDLFKAGRKFFKRGLIVCIPMIIAASFIPSNKQMMYMIGGYAVTNTENIEKLPKNVVNAANKFLEDYTEQDKK